LGLAGRMPIDCFSVKDGNQNWRVNFEYDIRYNSPPVFGRKSVDTNIIFGFSYDITP
jgi:hypothetical protein